MKRQTAPKAYLIAAILMLLGMTATACHQPVMPSSTVNKDVLNFRDFSVSAESVDLSTSVNGTIFVRGDIEKPDDRHLQISARLEIDPNDWGGVGFSFPQGWNVTSIASDYPQGNPAPDRYITTLSSGGEARMVYIGSSKMLGSDVGGGGRGSVIIDVEPASGQKDLPESLVITVGVGSKGEVVSNPVFQKIPVPLNIDYRTPTRPSEPTGVEADSITLVTNGETIRLDKNSPSFIEISKEAVRIIGGVDSSLTTTSTNEDIQQLKQGTDYLEVGFNPQAEIMTSRIRAGEWETVNLSSAIFFLSEDYQGLVYWPDGPGGYSLHGSSVQFDELERLVGTARSQ